LLQLSFDEERAAVAGTGDVNKPHDPVDALAEDDAFASRRNCVAAELDALTDGDTPIDAVAVADALGDGWGSHDRERHVALEP